VSREDALADDVLALRAAEARDARSVAPGALRRAEARLQQEIGVGDLNTAVAARRWHLEQERGVLTPIPPPAIMSECNSCPSHRTTPPCPSPAG
jgi:hypothetical protein